MGIIFVAVSKRGESLCFTTLLPGVSVLHWDYQTTVAKGGCVLNFERPSCARTVMALTRKRLSLDIGLRHCAKQVGLYFVGGGGLELKSKGRVEVMVDAVCMCVWRFEWIYVRACFVGKGPDERYWKANIAMFCTIKCHPLPFTPLPSLPLPLFPSLSFPPLPPSPSPFLPSPSLILSYTLYSWLLNTSQSWGTSKSSTLMN